MSTLDDIEARLAELSAEVDGLRQQEASEVDLLDVLIAMLQQRRATIICWTATEAGDWAIAREVARHRDVGGAWGWGQADVEACFDQSVPIPGSEMTDVFGTDWIHVVALVRTAATLTPAQRDAYRAAVNRVYSEDTAAWQRAYLAVVVYDGPGGAALRALGAFVGYDYSALVAPALARRSEVQAGDIAQAHYDRSTRAWREEIGPVHPDDPR